MTSNVDPALYEWEFRLSGSEYIEGPYTYNLAVFGHALDLKVYVRRHQSGTGILFHAVEEKDWDDTLRAHVEQLKQRTKLNILSKNRDTAQRLLNEANAAIAYAERLKARLPSLEGKVNAFDDEIARVKSN